MYNFKAFAPIIRISTIMASRLGCATLITLCFCLLIEPPRLVAPASAASQVHAQFDLTNPRGMSFATKSKPARAGDRKKWKAGLFIAALRNQ